MAEAEPSVKETATPDATTCSERRFTAEATSRASWLALAGGLGAVALGAGSFGTWMHDPPLPSGAPLLAAGALATAVGLFVGDPWRAPLRVGELGVAVERDRSQPVRIAWCDVERVRWDEKARALIVEGAGERIAVSEAAHEAAVAWIVREALDRVPKRVDLALERSQALAARASTHDGHVMRVERPQVAGRRCKASGTIITFESDARRCNRCGQVYHRQHVPEQCSSCDAKLA